MIVCFLETFKVANLTNLRGVKCAQLATAAVLLFRLNSLRLSTPCSTSHTWNER